MPLTSGTRLGSYEIVAPLGAGGMGEVYRARDTRLGRDVAIKALPVAFAQDPARLSRFEREARLLASLSHPNIAGIHGLEDAGGARYLALEFVEGETLADHLARGPLALHEACEIGRQVAAGVEAAHENGVVHRDLKPGNIMITPSGAVKVLDFGLAKGGANESNSRLDLSASPTLTQAATAAGVILGTAAYMSPEQARGRMVDRRTDVWSFGCVLYECLTGRQAYEGDTTSDLIARILEREPDWKALPAATPPRVVELLKRCLTKDVTQRLRDIGEARIALENPGGPAATTMTSLRPGRAIAPGLAALFAILATAVAFLLLRPGATTGPVRRFAIPIEGLQKTALAPIAVARDGSAIAYVAGDAVWIRRLDQPGAVEVSGSKGGRAPFWSWDGKTIGFTADRKLMLYPVGAEQSRALCDIPESGSILGGAWAPDGRIVLAIWRGGLYVVSVTGGEARPFLAADSSTVDYHGPCWLPDGRTLLVYVHDKGDASAIAVVTGSPARLRRIYPEPLATCAAYSPSGYLLVTRESAMKSMDVWALPFSASRCRVTGPAVHVLDHAAFANTSSDGLLVAAQDEPTQLGQLVLRSSDGVETPIGNPEPGLNSPAISPDGRSIAFACERNGNSDIWVHDMQRGTRSLLAAGPQWEGTPVWSQDGRRLYYTSVRDLGVGTERIVGIASDGSGVPDTLARGIQPYPSPDGTSIVYTLDRRGNADLWTVRLDGSRQARPFLATAADEWGAAISPDGHWVAYTSNESGEDEVYVRRYPEGDKRQQVSVSGGRWPRWMPRGDGICFVCRDTLCRVPVGGGEPLALGQPRALFATSSSEFALSAVGYENNPVSPHPDGSRFVGFRLTAAAPVGHLLVLESWTKTIQGR